MQTESLLSPSLPIATSHQVIDLLGELISVCRDSAEGFQQASNHVSAPELAARFRRYTGERASFIVDLQALELRYGKASVDESGSIGGLLHRAWNNILTVVSKRVDQEILEEAERGEDVVVEAYRTALRESAYRLPDEVMETLLKQFVLIQESHDHIRELRNSGLYGKSAPQP